MVDEIIFLDRLDEIASVRTKLDAIRDQYAGLVVPIENRALHSPVAVRLVVRHADGRALKLGVISNDVTVRRLFRDEGVPVFRNVKSYRDYVARQSAPLTRLSSLARGLRSRMDRTAGVVVLLIIVALGGLMAYALLPSAIVYLRPASQPINDVIVIKADPAAKAIDTAAKVVPARAVNIELQDSTQVPTTGMKAMPDARALGAVTLTNRTPGQIVVPDGVIVKTPANVKFVITNQVVVPAGLTSAVKADVIAVNAGTSGNVARGAINSIEGPLDQQLSVFNETPTTDGGSQHVPVVVAADQTKAKADLIEKMTQTALATLDEQRRANESLPAASIKFTVLEADFDKNVGDQANILNLKLTGRASGTIFNGTDVNDLIKQAWQPQVPDGYAIPPESVKMQPPEIVKVDGDVVTFLVKIQATAVANVNESSVQDSVRWHTAAEAKTYLLRTLSLTQAPNIVFEPAWASRALRVRVVIEGDWAKKQ